MGQQWCSKFSRWKCWNLLVKEKPFLFCHFFAYTSFLPRNRDIKRAIFSWFGERRVTGLLFEKLSFKVVVSDCCFETDPSSSWNNVSMGCLASSWGIITLELESNSRIFAFRPLFSSSSASYLIFNSSYLLVFILTWLAGLIRAREIIFLIWVFGGVRHRLGQYAFSQ